MFHAVFLDRRGRQPPGAPYTQVSVRRRSGRHVALNPRVAPSLRDHSGDYGQRHLEALHSRKLAESGQAGDDRLAPIHAMLGGICKSARPGGRGGRVLSHHGPRIVPVDLAGQGPQFRDRELLRRWVRRSRQARTGGTDPRHSPVILDYVPRFRRVAVTGQAKEPLRRQDGRRTCWNLRKVDPGWTARSFFIF